MPGPMSDSYKGPPMTIKDCPNCGGTHYGSIKCPYIKEPCVVCGEGTILACSDCAIDGEGSVHVCEKTSCRDQHESEHQQKQSEVQADWCAEYVKARESLAAMMIRVGFATGHGDTFDSLLTEAEWQIERLQRKAGEIYAPPTH